VRLLRESGFGKCSWETIFCGHYRSIFDQCDVIADYWLNFGHFAFFIPLGHLGARYAVQVKLIGKLVVDFLFVLIELFSLSVTSEALRVNID